MKKGLIEMMYEEEMKEHFGYERSENKERGRSNYRNGSYGKRVKSREGEIELEVPRDRAWEYEPKVVPKGKGDILGIEDKIIGLYGSGMRTRDICENILSGIKEALKAVYTNSDHQMCIVHQIRNSVKHLSYKDVKKVCEELKKIYKASTAELGYGELDEKSNKNPRSFPSGDALLKSLFLGTRRLEKKWTKVHN
jgi:transposase-like protein